MTGDIHTRTGQDGILRSNELIESVLARYDQELGVDAELYRNHVYRGLNYQLRLLEKVEASDAMALAWVAHDLGIWTANTFDYLAPSLALAEELAQDFSVDDADLVQAMVAFHHRLRPCPHPLVETFRRADRTDAWRGRFRGRLGPTDVEEVVGAFPYCGFHTFLRQRMTAWVLRHPTRPFPMFRW